MSALATHPAALAVQTLAAVQAALARLSSRATPRKREAIAAQAGAGLAALRETALALRGRGAQCTFAEAVAGVRKRATPGINGERGKRPFYDPKLGASNAHTARTGPHGKHPAFAALQTLAGAEIGLQRMAGISSGKTLTTIAPAVAAQFAAALAALRASALAAETQGDKLRFSKAVAAFFERNAPGTRTLDAPGERALWALVEMQTRAGQAPTQAELRAELKRRHPQDDRSTRQWERFLKSTGLDAKLPGVGDS